MTLRSFSVKSSLTLKRNALLILPHASVVPYFFLRTLIFIALVGGLRDSLFSKPLALGFFKPPSDADKNLILITLRYVFY